MNQHQTKLVVRNVVEDGYTEMNIIHPTRLTEPQGIIKILEKS